VDSVHVDEDRDQWRALVSTEVNIKSFIKCLVFF
jgi:hypothetical protein